MPDGLLVVIGVVVGVAVGWFWGSSRSRPGMVKQLAETKVRGARAVEHVKVELAAELDRKERELAEARSKLDQDRDSAAKMQAQMEQALDQKVRLMERTEMLGAELRAAVDESFREVGQLYEIGASLERAVEAYTHAVEAVESRLLAATKRLKEMGVSARPSVAAAEREPTDEAAAPTEPEVEHRAGTHPASVPQIRSKH